MKDHQFANVYNGNFLNNWGRLAQCKKPVIAAISGYAVITKSSTLSSSYNKENI